MVYHPFITTCKKDLEYCKAILIFFFKIDLYWIFHYIIGEVSLYK